MEPAASIIDLLGGTKEVAAIVGRTQTSVVKWRLPKDSGGTGGAVPGKCLFELYASAVSDGISVTLEEFVFTPEQRTAISRLKRGSISKDGENVSPRKSSEVTQ